MTGFKMYGSGSSGGSSNSCSISVISEAETITTA